MAAKFYHIRKKKSRAITKPPQPSRSPAFTIPTHPKIVVDRVGERAYSNSRQRGRGKSPNPTKRKELT